jgi:predicted Zn-dependent protease
MLLTSEEARRLTDRTLGMVKADDADVNVTSRIHRYVRFAANNFQTSGDRETRTASVTVWIERRRGAATTSDLSEAALRQMVDEAQTLARLSPVDREYMPTLPQQKYESTRRYVEATAALSLADRARSIDEALDASEKAGVISAGFHQASVTAAADATRNGNFAFERSTIASLGMTARTPDAAGSGYFLRSHNDVRRLNTRQIAQEAIRRALESRSARAIEARPHPVILEAQAVADLLSGFSLNFDARAAEEGRSAFAAPGGKTRVGEKVFDERINILSDPWREDLPGPQAAGSGLPAQVVYLVRNGVLENLAYSRYWAERQKRAPTPGPVNRIVEGSGRPSTVQDMIQAADGALLVTRFWYIRSVDPRTATLTGLTRDGVWWVENGKLAYPVRNLRFNQSMVQMLAPGNVEMVGAPERVGASEDQGSSAGMMPALKLRAFNFTSQSDAV